MPAYQPLFSVVIPLYNKADTIVRTLRSVALQDFHDYEVVVVDDGSKDNGAELAEKFIGCERIRVIRQANAGVSAARNRGAAESKGKYIAFLDADDEWMPGFLIAIQDVLRKHPEAKVVGTGYERILSRCCFSCRSRSKLFVCNLFEVWPYFQPVNSSSLVIEKKTFLDVGGYRIGLRFWEDGEFWFRLAVKHKFYVVRKPLSRYNFDSLSSATKESSGLKRTEPHMELLKKWIDQGVATQAMKGCYQKTLRNKVATWRNDFYFWLYKRIRFYLWFSKKSHA